MRTLDEEIARRLQEAADSDELSSAKGYGKPLPEDPAWQATPEALRMPMKMLKDAGATPREKPNFALATRWTSLFATRRSTSSYRVWCSILFQVPFSVSPRCGAPRLRVEP